MATTDELIDIVTRLSREQQRAEIEKKFGFIDDQFSINMFEYAYIYLSTIFPENEAIISDLVHDKLFWAWWRIQYYKVEAYFILKFYMDPEQFSISKQELHKWYYKEHVFMTVFPDRVVMDHLSKLRKQSKIKVNG